jgi:putative PIN family toxin of toxin-antitoxin system
VRIVIDTNLLVSGVISQGLPRQLLAAAQTDAFELCTSEVLLAELLDVLSRAKFSARLAQAGISPASLVDDLRKLAVVVSPSTAPRVVAADPDDDHVLAAAVAGHADLIASGDQRHLLPLGEHEGIPIVTARQAVAQLEANGKA